MKVMDSVPVYNRKEYLEITTRSLYECSNIDKVTLDLLIINSRSTMKQKKKAGGSGGNGISINGSKERDV
ncbi:hypothetical protein AGMMS50222_08030 [Endomicrobiia bacterium]|nr:hypothetical protein AGMMS49531_08900 [Endomicrobiia bacterium]GHT66599.1 hypothetical protein AGMMS49556_07700 [Endomicrobiia bacterium]GHT70454.1 hypothetical protein AGMMS49950_05480 [Endomicrobiia bacterium]GHT76020.1 hypothetical protein AGMMS50222_08030 [Endomicrobiia bacterium]